MKIEFHTTMPRVCKNISPVKRKASTSSSRITAAVRQPAFEGPLKSLKRWSPKYIT
jgi:hypothetical protein